MSEIGVSSVSEKGQVTIPKEMRDILGLKAGDKVVFIDQNDQFVMRKARTGKLSQTLENQKPWKAEALEFQRKIRKEWD
ncbi:MAG: AbrB/MazE/SpoVT family DNA-binding domain-containing protein [Thaumarchaeota archaeon]|nr:MAG: AbrB/MazE/SpoVT family DNA-binding domain-containing protein [Nitrososphaerota archaeon]